MSKAAILLSRLYHLGVSIRADHGALRLRPASVVPADLLAELLGLLVANDGSAPTTGEDNTAADDEPIMPLPRNPERERLDRANVARVTGLLTAAVKRPPSWADPAALPSPGCRCSCCGGGRWWCERDAPKGWRCGTCHPPDHLAPGCVTTRETAPRTRAGTPAAP